MEAATGAGIYIPHLCHNPNYTPHGSCKLCGVNVNGRNVHACTFPAGRGKPIHNQTEEVNQDRQKVTQMLFVEGNHFCPSCEKTGNCNLQAVGYHLNMLDNHFPLFYPTREVDASHPDILSTVTAAFFANLCVRAGQEQDGKNVFGIAGRGIKSIWLSIPPAGLLKDSSMDVNDKAAHVCPIGAIIVKRTWLRGSHRPATL